MKHAPKPKALVTGDLVGTADADTFLLHATDGSQLRTIENFGTNDRLLLDYGGSYSDITTLDKPYDGMVINTYNGGHVELHQLAAGTEIDAYGVYGELHVLLAGVQVDSLWGWQLAGG